MTLLPTLNRPSLLKRFLKSAEKTSTPGLILVDREDWRENGGEYERMDLPAKWAFKQTESVKMGDKIREVFDWSWEWVNVLNDDHVIITPDWDVKLLEHLDGTNFVTCNDNWTSPAKASGATIWSMDLLKAVGFPIYPDGMIHLFIDDLWELIGKQTGCWDVVMGVTIEHHHALTGRSPKDETFQAVYGESKDLREGELWQHDEKVFHDWVRSQLYDCRNRIREIRGQLPIRRKDEF